MPPSTGLFRQRLRFFGRHGQLDAQLDILLDGAPGHIGIVERNENGVRPKAEDSSDFDDETADAVADLDRHILERADAVA